MTKPYQFTKASQLTEEQRANLATLATYLENLPENYEYFHMGFYFLAGGPIGGLADYAQTEKLPNECGTIACALGHGPAAGIKPAEGSLYSSACGRPIISWHDYTDQFCPGGSEIDDFFFSGAWVDMDDTHRGAAGRIRYFLAGNEAQDPHSIPEEDEEALVAAYQPFVIRGDDHIKKPQHISTPPA